MSGGGRGQHAQSGKSWRAPQLVNGICTFCVSSHEICTLKTTERRNHHLVREDARSRNRQLHEPPIPRKELSNEFQKPATMQLRRSSFPELPTLLLNDMPYTKLRKMKSLMPKRPEIVKQRGGEKGRTGPRNEEKQIEDGQQCDSCLGNMVRNSLREELTACSRMGSSSSLGGPRVQALFVFAK